MPQQVLSSVENNFTKGLITESTGLNFPENAATDTSNCEYTLVGDVNRRLGINKELNYQNTTIDRTGKAMSRYVWNNPGGDSTARLLVRQVGAILYFYDIAASTTTSPLSAHKLATTVDISLNSPSTFDPTLECTYADGHGYLFIYHPSCNPSYCTYSAGTITSAFITVNVRDFIGVPDGLLIQDRPGDISPEHRYNLINQGWSSGNIWGQNSSTNLVVGNGTKIFTVNTGVTGINVGDYATCVNTTYGTPGGTYVPAGTVLMAGTVSSYNSGTGQLVMNITSSYYWWQGSSYGSPSDLWTINPVSYGKIQSWFTAVGNYPSNADVWWYFKNASGVFDPATTLANVTVNTGRAPQGHTVLNAFNQDRSVVTGVSGITPVVTDKRPSNGAWFQGRVWYTGVSANQAATGDADFYSWSENIYFSQIVKTVAEFGLCYQENDPTSENLFDILPTDGGVITIPGTGVIYKLFPIANGMLVFAANGVWFITGSQGIGFAANDYTITKISSIKSISSTSFVDVRGLPYFWNEEGIYAVSQGQGGSLSVESITVGTILRFYNDIPFGSRMYVRGDYNPIDYIIQWTYRNTLETGINDRYNYDTILNYNVYNKAFFPYSISTDSNQSYINDVTYITYPTITSTTPEPGFKYGSNFYDGSFWKFQFAEEYDDSYLDWGISDYNSYFITGYKLRGQAIKKFQVQYIQMWHRTNDDITSYNIQSIWDYANSRNSGRWSAVQQINTGLSRYDTGFRRHKIRGQGFALQFKVFSVSGKPFDIQGWAVVDTVNQST